MNKKAQLQMVLIMIAATMIITVIALIPTFETHIAIARTGMHCEYTNLTIGENAACIIVDWTLVDWVAIAIFVAIGVIAGRRLTIGPSGGGEQ